MKNWFFLLKILLFVLICCVTSLAQHATTQKPAAKEDQRESHGLCPTVSVSCPAEPDLNEPFDFTATVDGGDRDVSPTYHWEVVNGEIIAGQGTPAIRVKALAYQTVTATVHIGGFDTICSRSASCSTVVYHPKLPPPKKIDSYGLISSLQVKTKLDRFAAVLKEHPTALGFISGHGSRQSGAGEVRKAVDNAKQYLVDKFGIQKDRIRTSDSKLREEFMVELWLIPMGSPLPPDDPENKQ
jgi:hypothetical protein